MLMSKNGFDINDSSGLFTKKSGNNYYRLSNEAGLKDHNNYMKNFKEHNSIIEKAISNDAKDMLSTFKNLDPEDVKYFTNIMKNPGSLNLYREYMFNGNGSVAVSYGDNLFEYVVDYDMNKKKSYGVAMND